MSIPGAERRMIMSGDIVHDPNYTRQVFAEKAKESYFRGIDRGTERSIHYVLQCCIKRRSRRDYEMGQENRKIDRKEFFRRDRISNPCSPGRTVKGIVYRNGSSTDISSEGLGLIAPHTRRQRRNPEAPDSLQSFRHNRAGFRRGEVGAAPSSKIIRPD
jgi:hypothetical protein